MKIALELWGLLTVAFTALWLGANELRLWNRKRRAGRRLLDVTFLVFVVLAIGCRAGNSQMPPTPPVYQCLPAPFPGTNYTQLNPVGGSTGPTSNTSFQDKPATGQYCYTAQSWDGSQVSPPSNIVQVTLAAGQTTVTLNWQPPAGSSGLKYIISRSIPTLVPAPLAPALGNPSTAENSAPAIAPSADVTIAINTPLELKAKATR